MNGVKRKKGYTVCGCVGPGSDRERVREGKRKRGRVCEWAWGRLVSSGVSLFVFMETDLRWFGVVYMWFGANMAGRRNKNAFKYVLQVLILSETQLLGIKNVVWGS